MDPRIYERMRELQTAHWWFAARREIIAAEIARLSLRSPAEILEVGCGPGGNLDMLGRFGAVQAIEPDEASRAYAAERSGRLVRPGFLPDRLPAFDRPFDLVAAFDVVEHVDDDAATVRALGALATPGGFVIATVPAYQWMWSRHDEAHHHKRRYRLPAFRRLFEQADLTVRRATYFNTVLFPPIAAVRLARTAARLEGGDDEAMPSPALNGILKGLFGAEKALLRMADLPFGVSILVIAQRAR